MSKYKLNINLSDEQLKLIKNGYNISAVVKKDNTTYAEAAWVTFGPFGQNDLNWVREYEVFASITNPYSSNFDYTPFNVAASLEVMDRSNSGETEMDNTGNNDIKL